MSLAISSPKGCCTSTCTEPQIINIPGASAAPALPGQNGLDGVSAFTVTTAAFAMPAELANVTVSVANSLWMAVGQTVFLPGPCTMQVAAIPNSVSVTLKNLKDTANSVYMANVAPATVIASNTPLVASGVQGPAGSAATNGGVLSGAGAAAAVLPGGLPPNTAGSWVYFNKTTSGFQFWDNSALTWKP